MTWATSPAMESSFSWMGPTEEPFSSIREAAPRWYRLGRSCRWKRGRQSHATHANQEESYGTSTDSTDVLLKLGQDRKIGVFSSTKCPKHLGWLKYRARNVNHHLYVVYTLDFSSDIHNLQNGNKSMFTLCISLYRTHFTVFEFLASFIRCSAILTSSNMASCSEFFRELRWSCTFTQIRSIIWREILTVWAHLLTSWAPSFLQTAPCETGAYMFSLAVWWWWRCPAEDDTPAPEHISVFRGSWTGSSPSGGEKGTCLHPMSEFDY